MGEWLEVTFRTNGVSSRVPRVMAKTGENGWFTICNVPRDGTMAVTASLGADSTDRIEIQVPKVGVARRELYLGSARNVAAADTTPRNASGASTPPDAFAPAAGA